MSTSEAADKALVYLECGGQLQHDTEHGEIVCSDSDCCEFSVLYRINSSFRARN
jgi:hypothetical protein